MVRHNSVKTSDSPKIADLIKTFVTNYVFPDFFRHCALLAQTS